MLFRSPAAVASIDLTNAFVASSEVAINHSNKNCLFYTTAGNTLGLTQNEIVDGVCDNLTLADVDADGTEHAWNVPTAFTANKVTVLRQFDDLYSTMYLPFALSAEDLTNFEVKEFIGINEEGTTVTFDDVTSTSAHTAYLIKLKGEDATEKVTATNVDIVA